MERSIDSARRKRTLSADPPRRPEAQRNAHQPWPAQNAGANPNAAPSSVPKPPPPGATPPGPQGSPEHPLRTEDGGRLKARPKRPQNFSPPLPLPGAPYRSKAG